MSGVRWSTFCTYPDGRSKFDAGWLLNPANVVTQFPSKPSQFCRLCGSYFNGTSADHVRAHEPSLRAWQKKKVGKVTADPEKLILPPNDAGKSGQDAQSELARDARYVFGSADRTKAHSATARERRKETFRGASEARRAEVVELEAEGLVPEAIADRLGISDRSVRRYLSEAA
jgi:hypothetical protein